MFDFEGRRLATEGRPGRSRHGHTWQARPPAANVAPLLDSVHARRCTRPTRRRSDRGAGRRRLGHGRSLSSSRTTATPSGLWARSAAVAESCSARGAARRSPSSALHAGVTPTSDLTRALDGAVAAFVAVPCRAYASLVDDLVRAPRVAALVSCAKGFLDADLRRPSARPWPQPLRGSRSCPDRTSPARSRWASPPPPRSPATRTTSPSGPSAGCRSRASGCTGRAIRSASRPAGR
jgi:hypothetical protein